MAGERQRQKCEGVRSASGKICGQPLFECRTCGATGCQKHDCSLRQFDKHDECKDCGSNQKHPFFGPAKPAPQSAPPREPRAPIAWRWIPLVGALMAFGAVLAFYLRLWNNPEQFAANAQAERAAPPIAAPAPRIDPVPASAQSDDPQAVCTCYDEAFRLAGRGLSVLSPEYETGFVACRNLYGVAGGDAWTDGWNARLDSKPFEASCRRYLRRN